jgi:hypothetical protein
MKVPEERHGEIYEIVPEIGLVRIDGILNRGNKITGGEDRYFLRSIPVPFL